MLKDYNILVLWYYNVWVYVRYNCGGLWGLGARPQSRCKRLRWPVEKKNWTSAIWPRGLAIQFGKFITPRASASACGGLYGPLKVNLTSNPAAKLHPAGTKYVVQGLNPSLKPKTMKINNQSFSTSRRAPSSKRAMNHHLEQLIEAETNLVL